MNFGCFCWLFTIFFFLLFSLYLSFVQLFSAPKGYWKSIWLYWLFNCLLVYWQWKSARRRTLAIKRDKKCTHWIKRNQNVQIDSIFRHISLHNGQLIFLKNAFDKLLVVRNFRKIWVSSIFRVSKNIMSKTVRSQNILFPFREF